MGQYLEKHTSTVSIQGLALSKKSYWLEEGVEIGDGKIEGLSAIGGGGQAAISFMPDTDEHPLASLKVHSLIFHM